MERLFERDDLPRFAIPAPLAESYDGDLGFAPSLLYGNFVASVDGVVTLDVLDESGHLISGDNPADQFVMALLRACADAVMIGAGTFRKAPGHSWRAEAMHPSPYFAELRAKLGMRAQPLLVVITASGEIDAAGLDDAWIVTTKIGEARLRGCRARVLASETIALAEVLRQLRAEGFARVLTEGGPTLLGRLIAEKLLDELFVTSAPALFGRHGGDRRKSLIDGTDVGRTPLELLSVRRDGSHLFLRYALDR